MKRDGLKVSLNRCLIEGFSGQDSNLHITAYCYT